MKFICLTKKRVSRVPTMSSPSHKGDRSLSGPAQSFLESTEQSPSPLCPHWGPCSGPESSVSPSRHSRLLCGDVAGQQGHTLLVDRASQGTREVLAALIHGSFQYIQKQITSKESSKFVVHFKYSP